LISPGLPARVTVIVSAGLSLGGANSASSLHRIEAVALTADQRQLNFVADDN
jgi:hypothetical protein